MLTLYIPILEMKPPFLQGYSIRMEIKKYLG